MQVTARCTRRTLRSAFLLTPALAGLLAGSCSSGSGGSSTSQIGQVGALVTKSDGTLAFVDPNQGGGALRLRLVDMAWGRLVDVHDIDATTGDVDPVPLFRDLVIDENTLSDGVNYRLERNPITLDERLIVLRDHDVDPQGFEERVRLATQSLAPVQPKSDDGTSPEPFSFVARNAALVLRFSDLLDDGPTALQNLPQTVRVVTGYRPSQPFQGRIVFDPNYGALDGGTFHSSRIIIDPSVTEGDLETVPYPLSVNALGLPASQITSGQPNISVRIPSRIDNQGEQFVILRGLGGAAMDRVGNGPQRFDLSTQPVVRAFRAGNKQDTSNGFLSDLNPPELIGGFRLIVSDAVPTPGGIREREFLVDLTFTTPCVVRPQPPDVIEVGTRQFVVASIASPPDTNGTVKNVSVRLLSGNPVGNSVELFGQGTFLTTYDPGEPLPPACWVTFAPQPAAFPAAGVPPSAQILVRFSEPMDPGSLKPFDTFQVFKGTVAFGADPATGTVVGSIASSPDLREHTFTPILPLHNGLASDLVTPFDKLGTGADYHMLLGAVTDLGGRSLKNTLPPVEFSVDTTIPTQESLGVVLRFNDLDEFKVGAAAGKTDLRGQFFYDLQRGVIRPRAVSRFPAVCNGTSRPAMSASGPVSGLFTPFAGGIQTPLSPLGSKLHAIYRYADMGWLITDESKYNLDLEGLSWSPAAPATTPIADFYERFEIRLSHCSRLPDEYFNDSLLPAYSISGLNRPQAGFNANILGGPSQQVVVHNRELGYEINPVDVFFTSQGIPMVPYPWNHSGGPRITYRWRDTSSQLLGGGNGAGPGVPMHVEVGNPLNLYGTLLEGGLYAGATGNNQVNLPTIALPLLMEFRCFPSSKGLGLNSLEISIARNNSAVPTFRAFSTGGIDANKVPVAKDPDLQINPTGGFNPSSTPPGAPTLRPDDNVVYDGQLDCIVKVSQVHTIFMDTVGAGLTPDYLQPVVEPTSDLQPLGTQVIVDFRGASGFNNSNAMADAVDATGGITAYGDTKRGRAFFVPNQSSNTYFAGIDSIDGARYLQLRFTFVNNVESGLNAELSAVGVPYLVSPL